MEKVELLSALDLERGFIDVLYLTNQEQMPIEIERLLKQRKLSYRIVPIEGFSEIRNRLDLIGTVIIDAKDTDNSGQLVRIIESLEMERIGVILLTDQSEVPIKTSSLRSTQSDTPIGGTAEAVSIDELWVRVSVNLAYRKRSSGIAVKPAVPPRPVHTIYKNKLAEQLTMTKVLADNLAEQLRLAGLVQQDFLPANLPNTDKIRWASIYLPAEWVSGDIYDIARLDEEHIGFYVADVVGHGMPAALLTIFLKQALVMRQTIGNSYRIFSPAEVMKNLNIKLSAQKLSGYQFATCCYCLLNTKNLTLTYARAGHPYPILIRAQEQPEQLEVRGSLLGVFEQAEFPQHTIQLKSGDKIILYSDGADSFIGNFNNRAGFCFTKEFLETRHMPIIDMIDGFNSRIQSQEIRESEIDDITVLGLEVLEE